MVTVGEQLNYKNYVAPTYGQQIHQIAVVIVIYIIIATITIITIIHILCPPKHKSQQAPGLSTLVLVVK